MADPRQKWLVQKLTSSTGLQEYECDKVRLCAVLSLYFAQPSEIEAVYAGCRKGQEGNQCLLHEGWARENPFLLPGSRSTSLLVAIDSSLVCMYVAHIHETESRNLASRIHARLVEPQRLKTPAPGHTAHGAHAHALARIGEGGGQGQTAVLLQRR